MSKTADYQALIDQEVWDFIERTGRWYPADAVERSIDEQRAIYTAMCREFLNGHPDGVQVSDDRIESGGHLIPVRRYTTATPQFNAHIIYVHGGGFVVGDLDSHDDVCAELCSETGLGVTSIDYRLAPEHKHPAAFDDCLAVSLFEAGRVGKALLLCGDSAGGNLCAAVSHNLRDLKEASPVQGQVLIYPGLGGNARKGSYITHANAPMLSTDEMEFYQQVRVNGEPPTSDVSFAPLHDTDFSRLPSTWVLSAECDPLSDDGQHYCDLINQAGGQAKWFCERGLVHGFLRARHSSRRAGASFKTIVAGLSKMAAAVS